MSRHYFLRGCVAVSLYAFTSQVAFADVTARDVWSEWKGYLESVGYAISGTETMSGGSLTISDLGISMQIPENAGAVAIDLGQLTFAENGDGTVSVNMPESIPLRIDTVDGSDKVSMQFDMTQSDAALVVSGTPGDMTYDYGAGQVGILLGGMTVNGAKLPPEVGRMTATLGDVTIKSRLETGDMRTASQQMAVRKVTYDMGFQDPETGDHATLRGTLDKVAFEGTGSIPAQMDANDFSAMLKAGFAVQGAYRYAAGQTEMKADAEGQTFEYSGSSKGGEITVAMDAGHLAYGVTQTAPVMNIKASELPFPVTLQAARMGFSIDMPVAKADEPQPFGLGLTVADFVMPEQLWSIFDPAGILPRDPATIAIDLTGKARIMHDLMDPATAAMLEQTGMPPGELHALTINDLRLSVAGAAVTGKGDFTFDNSDLQSFGGVPRPEGVVNLRIVGANGLIDRLIQMGLVSEDEAMGFRMMLGMLAVPGDGPDTLNSTIEVNEQGQVLANGQRIK